MFVTYLVMGLTNIIVSSAYIDTLSLAARPFSLFSSPLSMATVISHCSRSIPSMKSSGESESPWRRPLPCCTGSMGIQFSYMRDVDVVRMAAIQSLHFVGNPLDCSRVIR